MTTKRRNVAPIVITVITAATSGDTYNGPPFLFNDPATTEIFTLSLHGALPILRN